jgi:hypothetical protein
MAEFAVVLENDVGCLVTIVGAPETSGHRGQDVRAMRAKRGAACHVRGS